MTVHANVLQAANPPTYIPAWQYVLKYSELGTHQVLLHERVVQRCQVRLDDGIVRELRPVLRKHVLWQERRITKA